MILAEILRTHGLRVTTARRTVFNILHAHDVPLDIAAILAEKGEIDRASVYRTLELFVRLDIVSIIPIGWKKKYELSDPFRPHHHHLQCNTCGELVAIDTPELERLIETVAHAHGYQLSSHHIELRGTCYRCQNVI